MDAIDAEAFREKRKPLSLLNAWVRIWSTWLQIKIMQWKRKSLFPMLLSLSTKFVRLLQAIVKCFFIHSLTQSVAFLLACLLASWLAYKPFRFMALTAYWLVMNVVKHTNGKADNHWNETKVFEYFQKQ